MIDKSKRKTLKTIAIASGTIATGGVSGAVLAGSPDPLSTGNIPSDFQHPYRELGQLDITARLSALNNDLEVVVTNVGRDAVTITQITPNVARVARGEFDFSAVLEDGPLHLQSGASVTVPMQHKPVSVAASFPPLTETLKNTVSVITDTDSFASVTIGTSVTTGKGAAIAA